MSAVSQLSKRLQTRIQAATRDQGSCFFQAKVILSNPNTGVRITPFTIKHLTILQDFVGGFMDSVTAVIEVSMDEYKKIKDNCQDLECTLILNPADPGTTRLLPSEDKIILSYMAILTEQTDTSKIGPANVFGGDNILNMSSPDQHAARFDIQLALMSKKLHAIKNSSCPNTGCQGKITDLLRWACTSLPGVTSVTIIPPDNDTIPPNFQIPPDKTDPKDFFSYIQQKCNVYSKGLCVYFTDDGVFIYPAWDTDKATSPQKGVINIINGAGTTYQGLKRYHSKTGQDINLLAIGKPEYKTLQTAAAENIGTGFAMMDANSAFNYSTKVKKTGEVEVQDTMQIVTAQNSAGNASSSMQRLATSSSSEDVYSKTAALAQANGATLSVTWPNAVPNLIQPGHAVVYHYDKNNSEYETKQGKVTRAVYISSTQGQSGSTPLLYFSARLEVFLEPEAAGGVTTQQHAE